MRVVPNLYPALEGGAGRQEVVVHAPGHVRSLADLSGDDLAAVAAAWRARAREARAAGFGYVQAVVNEGRAAGASHEHSHSQLVWLAEEPPAVARERAAGGGPCRLCRLLAAERADGGRVVAEREGLVLLCPAAGRAPYELLLAPAACEPDGYESDLLGVALALLGAAMRRLRSLEGEVPLNVWLHTAPFHGAAGHWHFELLPRLTVFAGLELGAELYVNPLPPEEAAGRLRPLFE